MPREHLLSIAREMTALLEQMTLTYPKSPQRPGWIVDLGALIGQGQALPEADVVLSQLMTYFPTDALLLVQRAQIRYTRGDGIDSALADLQLAATFAPDSYEVTYQAARLLSQDGQTGRADDLYAQAISQAPTVSLLYGARADAMQASGDYAQAIRSSPARRRPE
jgi:tetratricopeptide (TPR) repeat protein